MPTTIKIAIADDHEGVRGGLRLMLEGFGFEVIIEADNGEDLISKITHGSKFPDLCILDFNMPVMNGMETTIALKSEWRSIKIIGFSMNDDGGYIMLSKGADRFLSKNCSRDEMYNTIVDLFKH